MKKIVRFSLLAAVLIIIISAILKNNSDDKKTGSDNSPTIKEIIKAEIEQEKQSSKAEEKPKKKIRFKSNDEIKKEYGKIETVHLWNGKVYTGAVVNSNELYTIVTVQGIVNIPMKDVKLREIIR